MVLRHAAIDRWFHWLSALTVLVLLGTAFLPILGFRFPWVTAHWIAGLVLTFAVLGHAIRALAWQSPSSMWISRRDWRDFAVLLRWAMRRSSISPPKPGKYSLAQKLAHHSFTLLTLSAIVTGMVMLVRIDTPWWPRNPYWLSPATWGVIYVVHGLAALGFISMVMIHAYFALRPEKRVFLRSMWRGWIMRQEYLDYHDPTRWRESRHG